MTEDIRYQPAQPSIQFEISWFDRFSSRIAEGRLPYRFAVTLIILLAFVVSIGVSRLQPSAFKFSPIIIYSFFQILYFLLVLRHLDLFAGEALEAIRQALNLSDEQFIELKHRFSHTPRTLATRGTALGAAFAVLLSVGSMFNPELASRLTSVETSLTPAGFVVGFIMMFIWIMNGLFVANIYHKLRMIDVIYTHWTAVNPFQPRPLYSLANYTGRTATFWMLPSLPWILLDPGVFSLYAGSIFSVLGLLIYILPLLGVHRLLEQSKNTLLDQNGAQVQRTIDEMSRHLENQSIEDFASLDSVLSGLERSRDAIQRISTWPWQVDSFRRMIAALILPLIIWMAQYFLGRLLGP